MKSLTAILLLVTSLAVFSQTMEERAAAVGGTVANVLDTDGVIATQQSMMGDGQIVTLNGATSFSSQASCGSDAHYLNVNGSFSVAGLSVNLQSDTDLDGVMDATYSASGIHGLCSNGYFKCASPSTATGCNYYEWVGDPLGDIERTTAAEIQQLYNCRCIDASCDANSAANIDKHLNTVGSGMVQNYQRQNPYFAVSDITTVGPNLQFHGRVSTACSATPPDTSLTNYFTNPETMATNSPTEQASNHYFGVTSSSLATADTSVSQSCSIINDVAVEEIEQEDIIDLLGSSDASISSCGPGCINVNLGSPVDNNLSANDGCTYFTAFAEFNVLRPDLITDVSLLSYWYDDKIHIDVNDSTIVTREGFLKTQPEPNSCDLAEDVTYSGPPINITTHFTSAGVKRLNSTVAVGHVGNQLARFRIRYDDSNRQNVTIAAASQGRNNLTCSYDLTTGLISCSSDGVVTVDYMDTTVDYDATCNGGSTTINLLQSTSNFDPDLIWPGVINGPADLTTNYSHVAPSCGNGLVGSFSITDTVTESDPAYWLGRLLRYEIETSDCLVNQSIVDSCAALELDACNLKDHSIDGQPIITNYSPTGHVDSPSTQIISSGSCNVAITADYFVQNKTYSCPSAPPAYSVDMSHLQAPTFSGGQMIITTGPTDEDDPTVGTYTMDTPSLPEGKPCTFECKVQRVSVRNQTNTTGNETQARDNDTTTEVFTRACQQDTCPLGEGETLLEPCGCLNQFAQANAAMEVLRLAGKDITCVP